MQKTNSQYYDERILIVAPFGRDALLIQKALLSAAITADVCQSVAELVQAIRQGAGAALIADEALREEAVKCLQSELSQQPPWSDFPLIVMTSGGEATHASNYRHRLLEPLGNVNLLERPLRTVTLVSSIKAALRERKRQYELAAHLAERETTRQELESRNEELVKVNHELEEFAYVASHDLQEPLRMVNIYTQLLVKRSNREDADIALYADYIHTGIYRMEKLIRDLLTFSRTIHPESITVSTANLSAALEEALFTLKDRIQENHATVYHANLPRVKGDETQLAHVFQNLLSNALKYRKKEVAPEITVSAEQEGKNWVITVIDNGIGFDPIYAERIFGLFKRLHSREYPGTGLGLAICQRIVERCGGRIWATGNVDQGATFSFALPSANAE